MVMTFLPCLCDIVLVELTLRVDGDDFPPMSV